MRPQLTILAQGNGWVVVAKPPRLLTHRTKQTPRAPAVLQWLRDQLGQSVYPIHRLDAPASGCLLFATEQDLAGPLSAALGAGQKTYVALVRGTCPAHAHTVINEPLLDDNRRLKDAQTDLLCLGSDDQHRASLVLARPTTGRYHQVRRHLRRLSHPIVGDRAHGDSHINRAWRRRGIDRLALHCVGLSLQLPSQTHLSVHCPLFADQYDVYRQLSCWSALCTAMPGIDIAALPVPIARSDA